MLYDPLMPKFAPAAFSSPPAEMPTDEELRARPRMKTSTYDVSRAALIALLLGLTAATAVVAAIYYMMQAPPRMQLTAIEIEDATGGFDDGQPDETPDVQSDAAPRPDASPVEVESDTVELEKTLDVLVDIATEAVPMLPEQTGEAVESTGIVGSSEGTGARPLGEGGGGEGGVPRSLRWLISFPDGATLDEYAMQLDYFGIELGKIGPDGTLTFASNLAASSPTVRTVQSGEGEERLYFSWKGGPRQVFDRQLYQKAGVSPEGTILHFYPKNTENVLAQLEAEKAQRDVKQIRRTFFDVRKKGREYEFQVSRQLFF